MHPYNSYNECSEINLMILDTKKTMTNKECTEYVASLYTISVLSLSMSAMFVSQFWCYIREHGFKQGRKGQRGVWVMQHETVCCITCAGRSLQEREEGEEVEKNGSAALRNHSPRHLVLPGGRLCAFPIRLRCLLSVCVCVWGGWLRVGVKLCKSWRTLQGPRLLLSSDLQPCAMLGTPVPSVPSLGLLWEGGKVGWGGERDMLVFGWKGIEDDLCWSMSALLCGFCNFLKMHLGNKERSDGIVNGLNL